MVALISRSCRTSAAGVRWPLHCGGLMSEETGRTFDCRSINFIRICNSSESSLTASLLAQNARRRSDIRPLLNVEKSQARLGMSTCARTATGPGAARARTPGTSSLLSSLQVLAEIAHRVLRTGAERGGVLSQNLRFGALLANCGSRTGFWLSFQYLSVARAPYRFFNESSW